MSVIARAHTQTLAVAGVANAKWLWGKKVAILPSDFIKRAPLDSNLESAS